MNYPFKFIQNTIMKPLLLCFFCLILIQETEAQYWGKPPFYFKIATKSTYKKKYKVIKGMIFMKNGNTLEGYIKLNTTNKVMISVHKDSAFQTFQDVTQVRLYEADTNLISQNYTDYFYIGINNRFSWYRKLIQGNIALLDNTVYCNEIPNYVNFNKILLQRDSTYKNIISFWTWSYKTDLVRSLNTTFSTSFKNKDFKTKTDVIHQFRLLANRLNSH